MAVTFDIDEKPATPEAIHQEDVAADVPNDSPNEDFKWSTGIILNLVALNWCCFAATWGLSVPTSSIGFIAQTFGETGSKTAWIAAAITIPNCVFQMFIGDLSDFLGRRMFLQVGCILGFVGMMVAGRASSIDMVIGGQVLSGIGCTLGYLTIPFISEIVPKDTRSLATGVVAVASSISTAIGPVIQGALITKNVGGANEGWRAGFYLGAALYGSASLLLLAFYKPSPRPNPEGLSVSRRLLKFDWCGIFMVTSGLTLFLYGLHEGGNPHPWSSARVLAPLIIGIACSIIFIGWEWKGTRHGVFDHAMFYHRNYSVTLVVSFVGGIVLFCGQAYLPQEIISLFTSNAILTGVYNLPFNTASMVGAIAGAIIMRAAKEGKWIVVGAYTFLTVGGGLMAVQEPHISFAAWFFPTALLGLGVGVQMVVVITITGLCTPDHLIAHAVSTNSAIRALGGSVGVVIFSQIYQSKVKTFLPERVTEAVIASGLDPTNVAAFLQALSESNAEAMARIEGLTPQITAAGEKAAAQAYADSYRFVWYSLIPFGVIAVSLALFLKPVKEQLTRQVTAGVRNAK
ncbi:major facilitator superfamily domain-containing protein [Aspergillus sergii]|uniref:Major facilitator superfamily domain-containing protein n=1 Tax=Aspergillus sergii TaxID=1034303 RepID=A0A5N6XH27_9EURO|nr:major facilitator superfamily domain-containing protein [Aspergillus sergii]